MDVADDLTAILADLAGVAAVDELTGPLLDARGSGAEPEMAQRIAGAITRAVIEASVEGGRFVTRRAGARTLVALDGEVTVGDDVVPFDGAALLGFAAALGLRADELLDGQVLVPATDAVPALRAVPADGTPITDGRLVRLAAASSQTAAANAASDLVPRTPDPDAVLRWTRAGLVGAEQLTPDALTTRVRARFPTVDLPPRPELDALVAAADLPFRWNAEKDTYVAVGTEPGALTTFTRFTTREGTHARRPTVVPATPAPVEELTPEVAAAVDVEEHLLRSLTDGGFVALRGPTDRLGDIRRNLAHFGGAPHHVQSIDLEARFLHHLRAEATRRNVTWERVLDADEPGSTNQARLTALAGPAVDAVVDEVIASGPRVVAWFPGALLRHQRADGPGAIDRLRDAATSRTGTLATLWLVVLSPSVVTKPTVDGHPVPVIGSAEWVDLGGPWISNLHRSRGRSA